jgi:hypothetical protein
MHTGVHHTMGVYRLELMMDPVVQDAGSFAAGICATATAHTQTYEIAKNHT